MAQIVLYDGVEAGLGGRIDRVEVRIEEVNDTLSRRITETEIRVTTAITDLTGTLHDVQAMLRARFGRRTLPDD